MKRVFFVINFFVLNLILFPPLFLISNRLGSPLNLEYKVLAAQDLLEKINSGELLYLIDCRPADEFIAGHIPGAVNVSIDSFGFYLDTSVKKKIKEIQKSEGKELKFVLIDAEDGEEYMPRSKLEELLVHLPRNKNIVPNIRYKI